MNEIKYMLDDEIKAEIDSLSQIEMGTEEYKKAVDGITKLIVQRTDIDRLSYDYLEKNRRAEIEEDKCRIQAAEHELNLKREKREKIDTWVKHGLTVLGLGVTTGLTVWGALKSWEFEDPEGYGSIVTSTPGKEFMKKLFGKK